MRDEDATTEENLAILKDAETRNRDRAQEARDYAQKRANDIREIGRAQSAADREMAAAYDGLADQTIEYAEENAEDIYREGEYDVVDIVTDMESEERMRKADLRVSRKEENRVIGNISMNQNSILSGSGFDLALEAAQEFNEDRAAINEQSKSVREALVAKKDRSRRKTKLSMKMALRDGNLQANRYHIMARQKDNSAYQTDIRTNKAYEDTMYSGKQTATRFDEQAYDLGRQQELTKKRSERRKERIALDVDARQTQLDYAKKQNTFAQVANVVDLGRQLNDIFGG